MRVDPIRAAGAASILGGLLLALGWACNVPSVTLPGEILIVVAHGFLILGAVGVYAVQARACGWLGLVGVALAVVGGAIMVPGGAFYGALVPEASTSILAAAEQGVGGAVSIAGALGFVVGYVAFGVAIWRTAIVPRGGGLLLAVGAGLLLLGAGARLGQALGATGAVVMALGFVWLGRALLVRRHLPGEA